MRCQWSLCAAAGRAHSSLCLWHCSASIYCELLDYIDRCAQSSLMADGCSSPDRRLRGHRPSPRKSSLRCPLCPP